MSSSSISGAGAAQVGISISGSPLAYTAPVSTEGLSTLELMTVWFVSVRHGITQANSTTQANTLSRSLKALSSGPIAHFFAHPPKHFTGARCAQGLARLRATGTDGKGMIAQRVVEIDASLQSLLVHLDELCALQQDLDSGAVSPSLVENWNALLVESALLPDGSPFDHDSLEAASSTPSLHASSSSVERRNASDLAPGTPLADVSSPALRRGNPRNSRGDLSSSSQTPIAIPSSSSSSLSSIPAVVRTIKLEGVEESDSVVKKRGRPVKRQRSEEDVTFSASTATSSSSSSSSSSSLSSSTNLYELTKRARGQTATPKAAIISEEEHVLALKRVWRALWGHRDSHVFKYPVTPEEAPDYDEMVLRRMDLDTIKKKISPRYSVIEFYRDFVLMVTNALMYNAVDSEVYAMGLSLKKFGKREFAQIFSIFDPNDFPVVYRNASMKAGGRPTRSNVSSLN